MTDSNVDFRLLMKELDSLRVERDNFRKGDHSGGGMPPGGGEMEKRVEKLESAFSEVQVRLIRIEARFESIDDRMATKADLHEMAQLFHKSMNEQTWKFITVALSMSGLFAAIAFGVAHLIK